MLLAASTQASLDPLFPEEVGWESQWPVTPIPQLHSIPIHMEPTYPRLKPTFSSVGPQHT